MSDQLIITGFHRSGTSLVAQLLHRAGLFLGYELVGSSVSNPHGHFEDVEILEFHKELLADNKRTWQVDLPFVPVIGDYHRIRLQAMVDRRNQEHELWGFKEPRASLFLSHWRHLLPQAKVLIVYRHFGDSTYSLGKRHSTELFRGKGDPALHKRFWQEPDLALRMWLVYNEALLGFARKHPRDTAAVSMDMMQAEVGLVDALNARWGLGLQDVPVSAVFDRTVTEAVHRRQPIADRRLIRRVCQTWEALEELGASTARASGPVWPRLTVTQDDFDTAADATTFRLESEFRAFRVGFLEQRLVAVTKRLEERERTVAKRDRRIAELTQTLVDKQKHLDLKSPCASLVRQIAANGSVVTVRRQADHTLSKLATRTLGRGRLSRIRDRAMGARATDALPKLVRQAHAFVRHDAASDQTIAWQSGSGESLMERLRGLTPTTIIIPVHDAYEDVVACLEAVIRNTTAPAELLLVDDASRDARVPYLLAEYGPMIRSRVLTNETNQGYVNAVNRALSESTGDVVLLNTDTEVTPRWLENLTLAANLSPRTATATAVSNNAGAFSVPRIGRENDLPEHLGKDDVGRLVMQSSGQLYPHTPTGSGFCMYIKRSALKDVGILDAKAFPRGYGEENEFCMRATRRGWNHIVDDVTFVLHKREATFGNEKPKLLADGRATVDKRYPEYSNLAHEFVNSARMKRVGANVDAAYRNVRTRRTPVRPRVLFVLHHRGGGTPKTTADLMNAVSDRYSCHLLVSDGTVLQLFERTTTGLVSLEEWRLSDRLLVTEFSRPDYRAIVTALLIKYRFELVHIRHLIGHTFDLPELAAGLDVPVVLSLHDFYFSCPTVHLIDDNDEHCGGLCTPGVGQCRLPFASYRQELPLLKHAWVETWRHQVGRMFRHVDAFVTTSVAAKEVYLRSMPCLRGQRFPVIEHGRDLKQGYFAAPPGAGRIRVLIPGNIDVHKGARVIRRLHELDHAGRLDFHFLGKVAPEFRDIGVQHGPYEREGFNDRVKEIAPSFIGIFSIWPETYSHTLTEAWGAGVPVLASDIGVLKERITAHGGGWLIDYRRPDRAYNQIVELADDPEAYARELGRATLSGVRSTKAMADDYQALYETVLINRRQFRITVEHV